MQHEEISSASCVSAGTLLRLGMIRGFRSFLPASPAVFWLTLQVAITSDFQAQEVKLIPATLI